ncbi:MAG: cytidine deaminase [Clostridiales bacterium]|jgi:cytidine deaminase|nr:cytidine deaminase [Clostridiales bacterium]
MDIRKLSEAAVFAREKSYSPYSGFKVGAALLAKNGSVYTGCNIENAAYTPTICAERVAFAKAVSEGELEFTAIAVAGWGSDAGFAYPCGVCRQVMMEFCDPSDFIIIVTDGTENREHTLAELLPEGFGPRSL